MRVPVFQRGFIWNDEDRRLLFDSIQKGYPIGTLLLAQGSAKADSLKLGNYQARVEESSDALWVIDGQQRLSTLAMSLLGEHTGALRPLYFDLETQKFVLGPRRRSAPPKWVPTRALASSKALLGWMRDVNLSNALSDRADDIAGRIRDYVVPAYVVPYRGGDDRVPQEIFARINRRGRALKRHEVFDALHADAHGEKPIARVVTNLAQLGFGEVGPSVVERTAVALSGRAPGPLPSELGTNDEIASLFSRVEAGLTKAIEFLADEAGVPHVELLPYDGVFAALARFFDLHPRPLARNVELLSRWFWRGTLTSDHSTDNGVDGRKWAAIDGDEHATVQRLLKLLPAVTEAQRSGALAPYRMTTARTKIELLSMCDREPRVLVGDEAGEEVPIAAQFHDDNRKYFPLLIDEDTPASERTVAHVLVHGRVTLEALRAAAPTDVELASHAITRVAWEAFVTGDVGDFVASRRAVLEDRLERFLTTRAALNATDRDRPPLDTYFEEDQA